MSKKNVPQRPTEPESVHDDELVHVPVGQSRLKFLLILGLVIFVLLIFTVGSQLQDTARTMFGGGGPIRPSMTWVNPDTGDRAEVSQQDFLYSKRSLQRMADLGLFRPKAIGLSPNGARVSDEDVAMFLIVGDQATAAGVAATDAEVSERMRLVFTTGDIFKRWAAQNRTTTVEVQEDVRELLCFQKYKALLQMAVSVPSPDAIAELWAEQHPEYSFQYVVVDVADFEERARSAAPSDEELQAWFDELPEFQQRSYHTEEKIVPEIAWLDVSGEFNVAALLEKYPAPDDADPVQLARAYFNQVSSVRFRAEAPVDPENPNKVVFVPYEEVREVCELQAPVHYALVDWLADIKQREEEGVEFDFRAEAASFGLAFDAPSEGLSRFELQEAPGWGGRFAGSQLAFGEPGAYLPRVVHEKNAMIVGRLAAKQAGELPPFEDIREDIAGKWAEEHAAVIAAESLEDLRDQMGVRTEVPEGEDFLPNVDAETFARIATDAGYEVSDRPFLERSAVPDDDLANAAPADLYVRIAAHLFELEQGDVAAAESNAQGTFAFLVRSAGERIADINGVTAQQIANLRSTVAYQATVSFDDDFMTATADYAKDRYQIHLLSWEDPEQL